MATITYQLFAQKDRLNARVLWETITTTDTVGSPLLWGDFADRSVQVIGTFDAATLILEGSNDGGTTYAPLLDPLGAAVSFTATGIKVIGTLAHQIRPRLSVAGGGTADLDVHLFMRAMNR